MNDKRIFIDTGAYLARFHTADQRYQQAYVAWKQVQEQRRIKSRGDKDEAWL